VGKDKILGHMQYSSLNVEQKELAEFMGQLSERLYYASWMKNLEYVLWDALNTGTRTYGHGEISAEDLSQLERLAKHCGCWIVFDEQKEETAISLTSWKRRYRKDTLKNPLLTKG
jgi:hypothetical protein